jgi:cytochrome c oxidase subunit 2
VTGDLEANINLLINGVPGTAMAAYGRQLSPVQLAAVVTYIRNSFGNTTGDLVQPAAVNTLIQAAQ